MVYPTYCACCACEIHTDQVDCLNCGSRIRQNSAKLWWLCLTACLIVAIIFQVVHHYVQDHTELPQQQNLLITLSDK